MTIDVDVPTRGTTAGADARSRARAPQALMWCGVAVLSIVLLAPTLMTPVMADDFVNPFAQVDDGGASLGSGLSFGWRSVDQGASFRVPGVMIGSIVSWATLWISATFGASIAVVWAGVKLLMAIACAVSLAWLWRAASRLCRASVPGLLESVALACLTLFATVQIHADWSNDPVTEYPLVGYASAALGLSALALVVRAVERPTWWRIGAAALGGVVAVSYYEMNLGAIVGAASILGVWIVRAMRKRRGEVTAVLGSALVVLLPAGIYALGRSTRSDVNSGYAGTTTRLGGRALQTWAYGMVGSLPGAAWHHAVQLLGGTLGLVSFVLPVAALIAWVVFRCRSIATSSPEECARPVDRTMLAAIIAALVLYWAVSIAIHSVTIKVQDESHGIGYVYMSYAVGASVVALGLAVVGRWLMRRRHGVTALFLSVVIAVSLLFAQQTVNWRLAERLNDVYAPNRRLLDAFSDDASRAVRCEAIDDWSALSWPDYYEQDVTDGLQKAYKYYFGEPFCEGFVRPP
jgi:hypothetical protein